MLSTLQPVRRTFVFLPGIADHAGPPQQLMIMSESLHQLGAAEAALRIAQGQLSAESLVRACLERIAEREPEVAAWAHLNPAATLAAARTADRLAHGALRGVPVGFKDIVDTADMPTSYGSPIYRGHRPRADAVCVANTRVAGAIVLGKTVTTEFASRYPGPTRNPHDGRHTPGGSSSGSAAAVADCMVPLAVGTQTAGSVIRPAAYCGVFGYKPSFGLLSFSGVRHLAESLDTLGCMARNVADLVLFRDVMLGIEPAPLPALDRAPRIGFCRTAHWDDASNETQALLEDTASRLARAGAEVSDFDLPEGFGEAQQLHHRLSRFEVRNCLSFEAATEPENLSASATKSIELGRTVSLNEYLSAMTRTEALRQALHLQMASVDVLLTPSAPDVAPLGLTFTGATPFNFLWTLMYTPAVTVPGLTGSGGLPVGVQVVGPRWEDDRTLAAAQWVARHLS